MEEIPHILRQVIYESEHGQRRFEISTRTHLDDPLATIGTFNRQFQITKKEAETIEQAWHDQRQPFFPVDDNYFSRFEFFNESNRFFALPSL